MQIFDKLARIVCAIRAQKIVQRLGLHEALPTRQYEEYYYIFTVAYTAVSPRHSPLGTSTQRPRTEAVYTD